MKYRQSFLIEVARFDRCGRQACSQAFTDLGLQQFYEFESHGKIPNMPDPYFTLLCDGKAWWEWTLNEYAKTFFTENWMGWRRYAEDFINDKSGFRQLRQRLYHEPIDPKKYIEEYEQGTANLALSAVLSKV